MDIWGELIILGEVALSLVLGGLIGLEREFANRPAGFRTHMLVAGASTLLMGLGHPLLKEFAPPGSEAIQADPVRLIEAIVTGIAFLGAGAIIRRREEGGVAGLTTAGSILMAGVIGICISLHQFLLGIGATILTLFLLRFMRRLEARLGTKKVGSRSGGSRPP